MRIKIFHNDYPEELEKQIRTRFGEDTVCIVKTGEREIEVDFDTERDPWRHIGEVARALDDLMEENEWISSYS